MFLALGPKRKEYTGTKYTHSWESDEDHDNIVDEDDHKFPTIKIKEP